MSEIRGVLNNFYQVVIGSFTEERENHIVNLECNAKRVQYLSSFLAVKWYDFASDIEKLNDPNIDFPVKKDLDKALALKLEGDEAKSKSDFREALKLYDLSIFYMPKSETLQLAHVFAKRANMLKKIDYYEESILNVDHSVSLGLPIKHRYKVHEIKARCLILLYRYNEGIPVIKETLQLINQAEDRTIKQKRMTFRQINDFLETAEEGLKHHSIDTEPINFITPLPELSGDPNVQFPAASEAIRIEYSGTKGKFATATRDIMAGEVLLVEKRYCAILESRHLRTYCQNCFIKCPVLLTCPKCTNVVFCSNECLDIALNSYHGYECHILPLLMLSNCVIFFPMALRMITQNNKEYFTNISSDLEDMPPGPYRTDDYRYVYHLEAHQNDRTHEGFIIQKAFMALVLVKFLELSGYFDGKPRDTSIDISELKSMTVSEKYKDDAELFGGLLMKNLQIVNFNAHIVYELLSKLPFGEKLIKLNGMTYTMGKGLFPTLSLFNHSCDASIVRYFSGQHIVARAIKNIKKGEEVFDCYHDLIFTHEPKDKRQKLLKDDYWFDCTCMPCFNNWPLYDELPTDITAERLDMDNHWFDVQYNDRDRVRTVLKIATQKHHEAAADILEGEYEKAIEKLLIVVEMYGSVFLPPSRYYYNCVEHLRKCMQAAGNFSIVPAPPSWYSMRETVKKTKRGTKRPHSPITAPESRKTSTSSADISA